MGFVNRCKFAIFDETIYYNENTVIIDIIDRVLRFG